jgi:CheY-like chemotaxis protein
VPHTIVVIDGDAAHRGRIAGALEAAGYRALAAADGESAITAIDAEPWPPALIVLAWSAALVREAQLFDALDAVPRRADIPVVVLAEAATAPHVPARAAAVLDKSARMRTLLGVVARLSGAAAPVDDREPRRERRRAFARACRIVTRTLVDADADADSPDAEADTARYERDQETAGPT